MVRLLLFIIRFDDDLVTVMASMYRYALVYAWMSISALIWNINEPLNWFDEDCANEYNVYFV